MTRPGNVNCGRRLWPAAMLGGVLLLPICGGCSSGPGGSRAASGSVSTQTVSDDAQRKRAAADKFPTAQQAGIASDTAGN